jgi:hypothetical protein
MTFEDELEDAAIRAAEVCRKISRETYAGLDASVKSSEKYGAETEAVFKALLYAYLRKDESPTVLTLEPGKIYNNADLAYCPNGLAWKQPDSGPIYLIEVKQVARDGEKETVRRRNLMGGHQVKYDIDKLNRAKNSRRFPKARLIQIVVFMDYDAEHLDKTGRENWRQRILGQLDRLGVKVGDVELLVY